ncbi:MAG: hypothetical protein IKN85_01920 [Oscillospiraceae bacterium]|nr:hypothetical protein [Oscillospiraceae bacterium]MBR6835673.1 hypothetical protein [Oscillospiraceae bacterium]
MSVIKIFEIVGTEYFKALTGKYQNIFIDCLEIIYESYRTELSYGVDKEVLVAQMCDYFDQNSSDDIQFDEEQDVFQDSRSKANEFLRKLKGYGWIEYEFDNNGQAKIVMPGHSITIMQALTDITKKNEMEYQSEVSSIYSLLTNENLLDRPYPQVIKPVYDRTIALFTELKKLNTGIRKYIDELTDGQTPEEIMQHFFSYNDNIGSKAYHRMKTNDNVSRFRNTIESRLKDIMNDEAIMERAVIGYRNIENENDRDEAHSKVIEMITGVISYFNSYDEIEKEIERKHSKYLRSAVNRAKFAFLNTNNIEGKLSTILRNLANAFDAEENRGIYDDVPDDYCRIFNMFPQNFISGESLKTIGVSKKINDVDEIFTSQIIPEEELIKRHAALKNKTEHRFSRKNINAYVQMILKDKTEINASEIELTSKRDMIRLIFICIYGRDKKSEFIVTLKDNIIHEKGFTFKDFTLKRRAK